MDSEKNPNQSIEPERVTISLEDATNVAKSTDWLHGYKAGYETGTYAALHDFSLIFTGMIFAAMVGYLFFHLED